MAEDRLLLYASPNGDLWWLCRGDGAEDVVIAHEPNGPSGGRPSRIGLGRFLGEVPPGPQHHALLRLVGTLVTGSAASSPQTGPAPEAGAAAAEPTPGEALG